jgi:CHAD domain-containing protein
MTGHTALQLAGRHMVKRYLYKLRKHAPKVRKGEDPEDVHDMRVATRRIRSTLQILEDAPGFEAKRLRKMRSHLRALAHELGAVRDLDVFLGRLADYESERPEAVGGLRILRDELERRRDDARAKLAPELETSRLRQRLRQVEEFATQRVDISGESRPTLVRHFAGAAIWRRYQDVLTFECELPGAPPPDLHRLRIACKRLRYAIETFEPALGSETKPIVAALVAVQDHLGALQDIVVALQTVQELREQQGNHGGAHHRGAHHGQADHSGSGDGEERATALSIYADTLALRRDELMAGFGPLWERISDDAFRCALASLIAGL